MDGSQSKVADGTDVPLVEFVDIDRDGMLDLFFYHEGKIYVYYNLLPRRAYSGGLTASYLCFREDEV